MNIDNILTINELRSLARKRTPNMFYEYMEAGSWSESTLNDNRNDFKKIKFRQRVVKDISNRSTKASLLGSDASIPLALAPCGLAGMMYPDGEIHAALAAEKFGVPYTL